MYKKIIEEYFNNWFEVTSYLKNLDEHIIEFGDVLDLDIQIKHISNCKDYAWRLKVYGVIELKEKGFDFEF